MKANRRIDHMSYGLHSNIPLCCVKFFIDVWDRHELWERKSHPYVQAVDLACSRFQFRYVPCPSCLVNRNVVELLDCQSACGGNHLQDFELAF